MMRVIFLSIVFLLIAFFGYSQKNRLEMVKDGKFIDVIRKGHSWQEKEDHVWGMSKSSMLYTGKYIEAGDFHMHARISLKELNRTTALFWFFNNHFGFDSDVSDKHLDGKNLYLYSPVIDEVRHLDANHKYIKPDVPFDFDMVYAGQEVRVSIDGKEVAVWPDSILKSPMEGVMAFRPWRNQIKIYDWWLEGSFTDFPDNDYLFERGEAGYSCFRIPNIVETNTGSLLAFAEGRKKSCQDNGDVDIVMKRSEDGGQSWSELQVICDDSTHTNTYQTIIVDRESNKIIMLYAWNRGADYFKDIYKGVAVDTRHVYSKVSTDDGLSWSEPKEITESVKLPDWTYYGLGYTCPIQLQHEAHKNRILVAAYHGQLGIPDSNYVHLFYSDDIGETWHLGAMLPIGGLNETELVELHDGRILLSMRTDSGIHKHRRKAYSLDGGLSICQTSVDKYLGGIICQGSFARQRTENQYLYYYSHPDNDYYRERLTLWRSDTACDSWAKEQVIYRGCAAYSDIIALKNGRLACVFECGHISPYDGIVFKWLR